MDDEAFSGAGQGGGVGIEPTPFTDSNNYIAL